MRSEPILNLLCAINFELKWTTADDMKQRVCFYRLLPEQHGVVGVRSADCEVRVRVAVKVHSSGQREPEPADILTHRRTEDHLNSNIEKFLQ